MSRNRPQGKPASTRQEIEKMSRTPLSPEEEWKHAEPTLAWHGWGSPVGLGMMIVSLGVAAALLRVAVLGF
jgi:hypothetical protein